MVLVLNGNQVYILREVLALSTEQELRAIPRRLSDQRPDIEGLSSADAEGNDDFDEYADEKSD